MDEKTVQVEDQEILDLWEQLEKKRTEHAKLSIKTEIAKNESNALLLRFWFQVGETYDVDTARRNWRYDPETKVATRLKKSEGPPGIRILRMPFPGSMKPAKEGEEDDRTLKPV